MKQLSLFNPGEDLEERIEKAPKKDIREFETRIDYDFSFNGIYFADGIWVIGDLRLALDEYFRDSDMMVTDEVAVAVAYRDLEGRGGYPVPFLDNILNTSKGEETLRQMAKRETTYK